ncbi:hypothetical protein ACM67C_03230 [Bergeriella denitrificans]|uniref:hypothetical protein n=1 Tax=Bergeriella denitrificans TaxID=494 RepID=UPI0011C07144|nr:hypothetical protein [Bergeriella denitrificans]
MNIAVWLKMFLFPDVHGFKCGMAVRARQRSTSALKIQKKYSEKFLARALEFWTGSSIFPALPAVGCRVFP